MKARMFVKLLLVSFFLLSGRIYSQTDLKYDSINFENEKNKISDFIISFISTDNSKLLQNSIDFSLFYFYPHNTSISPIPIFLNSKVRNRDIKELAKPYYPANQVYYLQLKYFYNSNFKKKIDKKEITISDYIYKDPSNKLEMSEYIIRTCKFPLENKDAICLLKVEDRIDIKDRKYIRVEYNVGRYDIGITKINQEYKVISICTNQIIN